MSKVLNLLEPFDNEREHYDQISDEEITLQLEIKVLNKLLADKKEKLLKLVMQENYQGDDDETK